MNTIEKIIQLIKTDKEIANYLFLFYSFPEDVTLWTGLDEDSFDYTNIKWLFITEHPHLTLIGVNTIDNTVWCIDDEGDFHQDCDALENLPYEIIRVECSFTEHETVEDYFEKYKDEGLDKILWRYEDWCRHNGIELDKNKIYHYNDGKLFNKSFDII